jgi:hypothetical protein
MIVVVYFHKKTVILCISQNDSTSRNKPWKSFYSIIPIVFTGLASTTSYPHNLDAIGDFKCVLNF